MSRASSSSPFPQFHPRAADDTVFYAIYPDPPPPELAVSGGGGGSSTAASLLSLHLRILHLLSPFLDTYIWQHEPFLLSLPPPQSSPICHFCSSPNAPHLHGKTRFGDNLEDEWFIVFLLLHLTRSFSGEISARVRDSDGEFLLIEAAFAIPRWLSPENSTNRVFIRDGSVHIVPRSRFPSSLSLPDALSAVRESDTRASDAVQSAISRRVSGYPERARANMHRSRVRVPLLVAQVLRHEPRLISMAVEGFYDRDVDSMKHAARMERFLCGGGGAEMVRVSVRMSRVMFAQLVHQRFQEPRCYPLPGKEEAPEAFAEWELGMKIACGFEMAYQERRRAGKEGKGSAWEAFVASLENSGCFEGLLPGSMEYQRIMASAEEHFKSSSFFAWIRDTLNAPVQLIDGVLSSPYSVDDFGATELLPNDDDSWLYNGEDELNWVLSERQKGMEDHEQREEIGSEAMHHEACGSSSSSQKDSFVLGDIAQSMQAFVQKNSSFEGAEIPKNRNSGAVQLDAEQFMRDLESVLGSLEQEETSHGVDLDDGCTSSSGEELDDFEDERDFSKLLGDIKSGGTFMQSYSDALNKELSETTLQRSFVRAHQHSNSNDQGASSNVQGSVDDDEELTPLDVDVNLVKSFLDSYSSQQGLAGPASNLLGIMGLDLPRDAKQ